MSPYNRVQGRIQDFHFFFLGGGRKKLRARTHFTNTKSEVPYDGDLRPRLS